ncbi:LuxR family transcriptional regulator [Rhodosalinus halophilus]|uniref:LuxR family transcriptional regulator n=1 Tax=Rhodosalinus halophilus TaxID=2259333 RepID=A0A365UEG1_9RHOB|nr:LuxR family transcriptional regulator [Rhodosalinus halophilus]RBI87762.1 LuxR family transcriptional regulator [Rhodosalinus halophilus]
MDLIDLGQLPPGERPFDSFLAQLCQRLGFDYAAYAGTNPVQGTIHGYVTYPEGWKKHYAERGFQNIDPTLTTAGRSIAPVDWRRLERDRRFDQVFRDASDFGIVDRGLTVPVRGPYGEIGMLSVTRDCPVREWDMLTRRVISDLQSAAVHLHDTVMGSDVLSRALRHPALSTREIEILQWTAAGKSQQDIGDILGISYRTVEVHLRSARSKLFALTTPQAVGRAIGLGLITPL